MISSFTLYIISYSDNIVKYFCEIITDLKYAERYKDPFSARRFICYGAKRAL